MIESDSKESFGGQIGKNLPYTRSEKEEDILEELYRWQKAGRPLSAADICREWGLTKRDLNFYIKKMTGHGYLKTKGTCDLLELTEFGKAQGAQCLKRHHSLTQFFQSVGMDYEQAEEDACRMEHVLSEDAVQGIHEFLTYGDTYDRVLRHANLCCLYQEGDYKFCMSMYQTENRYPRLLAAEFKMFYDEIHLHVNREGSYFCLRRKSGGEKLCLWYRPHSQWEQASMKTWEYRLPTELFEFVINREEPVIEGECLIAFTKEGERPQDKDCRECNVHIWLAGGRKN